MPIPHFDETVYMLQIPTDKPELLEKGYQVIEDWAHQVTLEDVEIEKERGVIIEEWRLGLGANERMHTEIFPRIIKKFTVMQIVCQLEKKKL